MDIQQLVLTEMGLFLVRPGTKPSHRIYALGFLNKAATTMISDGDFKVRTTLL